MTERTTVVLHGAYERAFLSKAIAEGYAKIDTSYPDDELQYEELAQWDYEMCYKHNPHKTAALQMFLLFDKVILVGTDPGYDCSRMEDTGLIEALTWDEDPLLWGRVTWDRATKEYAMFLKPIVLDYVVKYNPAERRAVRSHGVQPRTFYSALYDRLFSDAVSENIRSILRDFESAFVQESYSSSKSYWDALGRSKEFATGIYRQWFAEMLRDGISRLMTMLELSVLKNAVLVQSEFSMRGLDLDSGVWQKADRQRLMDSYQILRLSFERLIGTLPRLHSLEDVLRLKDKRRRDIRRLRSVLNNIEHELREGKRYALNKAEREVREASLELARGNTLQKVSKWTSYLSLPVGMIEACFGLPPVTGLALKFIGTATTLSADVAKAKNGWLQVVR